MKKECNCNCKPPKKYNIECHCQQCGAITYYETNTDPKKVNPKDLKFTCNDCVAKNWETKQLILI